jgi:hypothetical protein
MHRSVTVSSVVIGATSPRSNLNRATCKHLKLRPFLVESTCRKLFCHLVAPLTGAISVVIVHFILQLTPPGMKIGYPFWLAQARRPVLPNIRTIFARSEATKQSRLSDIMIKIRIARYVRNTGETPVPPDICFKLFS